MKKWIVASMLVSSLPAHAGWNPIKDIKKGLGGLIPSIPIPLPKLPEIIPEVVLGPAVVLVPPKVIKKAEAEVQKAADVVIKNAPKVLVPGFDPITQALLAKVSPQAAAQLAALNPTNLVIAQIFPEKVEDFEVPTQNPERFETPVAPSMLVMPYSNTQEFVRKEGKVIINGNHVLQKDTYIFADTVQFYGQIVTLDHNLTIICRNLVFLTRKETYGDADKAAAPALRAAFRTDWPHIAAITGGNSAAITQSETQLVPGKIKIIAGKIFGQPIIHHSRTVYERDAGADAVSEVSIEYGRSQMTETDGLFAKVVVGTTPEQKLQFKPEHNTTALTDEYELTETDARTVLAYLKQKNDITAQIAKVPQDANASSTIDELNIFAKSYEDMALSRFKKIRTRLLERDEDVQEMARQVDSTYAAEVAELFTPDAVNMTSLREQAQQDVSVEMMTLQLDSPKKWSLDLVSIPYNQYATR